MTEAFYNTPDYLSDHTPQLDAISNRVLEIIADPDTYIRFDFAEQSSEIIRDRKQFPTRQAVFAIQQLIISSKSQPMYGIYASTEVGPRNRSLIESAILIDEEEAAYAVRTSVLREDEEILESFSCVHLHRRPTEVSRHLMPRHDEFIDTFDLYTQDTTIQNALIWILRIKLTDNDLELAFNHVLNSTAPKEKEAVAMLIQYIRIRLSEEKKADELAKQYGTDKPNYRELHELLQYLHS